MPLHWKLGGDTFGWLWKEYLTSTTFKELGKSTQDMRRRIINNLVDDYGTAKYEDMDRKIVMGIRDKKAATPAAANKVVDMIKCIYAWGLDQ